MSQEEIRQRWAKFNLLGTGKDRSSFDTVWYRGDTIFLRNRPGARVIKYQDTSITGGGKIRFICLHNGEVSPGLGTEVDATKGTLFDAIHFVTCVGVFSRYEGDCMHPPQLHDRLNFLFNREFAERAVDYQYDTAADYSHNPQHYVNTKMSALHTLDKQRLDYAWSFRLNWQSFDPERFRSEIAEYYITGAERFNHPSAVAKRERAAARRTAKKAFGVA